MDVYCVINYVSMLSADSACVDWSLLVLLRFHFDGLKGALSLFMNSF
jgi:hypothetical protein